MKASVGVKRLLMYLVVLICVLFVAFIAYYFARNDENVSLTIDDGGVIYLNKGDSFALPILHEDADKDTKLSISISDSEVLNYSEATLTFVAAKGGMSSVTINVSNKDFGPFRFDVMVGDGSVSNPYYVSSAIQLAKIGVNPLEEGAWLCTDSYELINDINLASCYTENTFWTPIGNANAPFSGRLNGNGYTISNLKINGEFDNAGLFGTVSTSGSIEGIRLTNAEISNPENHAYNNVGFLVGDNFGSISKIIVNGKINLSKLANNVGGIAGQNSFDTSSASISNCSVTMDFVASTVNFGGIVAVNFGGVLYNCKSVLNIDYTAERDCIIGGIAGINSATSLPYVRPIIKNCYTIIESNNKSRHTGLIVAQNIEQSNIYSVANVYVSNYGYSANSNALCIVGKNPIGDDEMQIKTKTQLQEEQTFVGWDFEQTWAFDIYPTINIDAPVSYHGVYIPGTELTTKKEVSDAILRIIENPSVDITYTIKSSTAIVIDCKELLNGELWTPIGTYKNPFKGKLIVDKDTSLTFTNIENKVDNGEVGFFGVSVDAIISNIKFTNIRFTKSNKLSSWAGGIVAYPINSTIQDCNVDDISLKNFDVAGMVVGNVTNSSVILNCHVGKNDVEAQNQIINETNVDIIINGGIAGRLYFSTIKDCSIDYATIKSTSDAQPALGGIAGSISNSNINNCYNIGCNIEGFQKTQGNYGGVVGSTYAESVISSCYNLGKIEASSNGDSYAGGIVGYNSAKSIVEFSFSKTSKVQGRYVGGLCAFNHGIIRESYSDGEYRGIELGGFAYKNTGKIYNCYTLANIVGTGKGNYAVAGMVAYLPKGGSVSFCFSTASISGSDSKLFAETSARVRYSGFESWFDDKLGGYEPGEIANCVVINYGDAQVQKKLIFGSNKSWIECSDDDCRGLTANDPFETAEFTTKSVGIWTYVTGEYPTLTNCVVDQSLIEDTPTV